MSFFSFVCPWFFSLSQDGPDLQGVPGGEEPHQAALVHTGVLPDQTGPEGPEVPPPAEGAGLPDRRPEPRTQPPHRYLQGDYGMRRLPTTGYKILQLLFSMNNWELFIIIIRTYYWDR